MAVTSRQFLGSLSSLSPLTIAAGTTGSYIAFYTAYDKGSKKLTTKNLIDYFTLSRGLNWTLTESNKVISLAGLTTFMFAFLPVFKSQARDLTWISMNMLWTHSIYSLYKFYGLSLSKMIKETFMKRLSLLFGATGQFALAAGYWGYIDESLLVSLVTFFGMAHFWTMEVHMYLCYDDGMILS